MELKIVSGLLLAVALVMLMTTGFATNNIVNAGTVLERNLTGNVTAAELAVTTANEVVPTLIGPASDSNSSGDKTTFVEFTTSGTATAKAMADKVEIYVGVEVKDRHAADAEKEVADKMEAIRSELSKTGVTFEIETSDYSIYPNYDYYDWGNAISGYTTSHIIIVRTNETDKVGKLIDAASEGGSNKVSVVFSLSDEKRRELELTALSNAAKNAKAKADSVSSALDLRVERIVSITENVQSDYYPYRYYMPSGMAYDSTSKEAPTSVEPTGISVSATVSMVFEFG